MEPGWRRSSTCARITPRTVEPGRLRSSSAQQGLCRSFRGGRVLTGDQAAIDDRQTLPVVDLFKVATQPFEFVLDEEWDDIRQVNRLFFRVGEPSHPLAFDDGSALGLHVP